jgi:DNA-binding MltR family transcriptional regulator
MTKRRLIGIALYPSAPGIHAAKVNVDFAQEFHENLKLESDRGVVLMTAAVVDDLMRDCIIQQCTAGTEGDRKQLFKRGGSFESTANKIEWLFCSGRIDKTLRDDLHLLRELRNRVAHNWRDFRIDETLVADVLQKMSAFKGVTSLSSSFSKTQGWDPNDELEIVPRATAVGIFSILIAVLCSQGTAAIPEGSGKKRPSDCP